MNVTLALSAQHLLLCVSVIAAVNVLACLRVLGHTLVQSLHRQERLIRKEQAKLAKLRAEEEGAEEVGYADEAAAESSPVKQAA